MDLREQLEAQLAWGNEAEKRIVQQRALIEELEKKNERLNAENQSIVDETLSLEKEAATASDERERFRWALEYTWIWMVEHHATPSMSRAAWFRYVEERRQMHGYEEDAADD